MINIRNERGAYVSVMFTLIAYFDSAQNPFRPGYRGLSKILKEIRAMSAKDQEELAIGAAKEMGWDVNPSYGPY